LPPVILLAGPTAVGKTSLSIRIADLLGTEIINADSMQVYRHMDIGTAKPGPDERSAIRHHLLDVVAPDEPFDAAAYLKLAGPVVDSLHKAGRMPIVVGGTGLYMKVLTRGICEGAPSDPGMRREILREAEEKGLSGLYAELARSDPRSAAKINPNDRQRISRALEVYRLTGMPLTRWQERHRFEREIYRSIKIFIYRSREDIYDRIDGRVLSMIEQGFVDEVQSLLAMGYGPDLKPMQALGYKQIVRFLQGACTLEAAIEQIQRDTRRYAKRQFTWFRGDRDFQWIHAEEEEEVISLINAKAKASGTGAMLFV
jgi:tRNA dimethylallyltransferase